MKIMSFEYFIYKLVYIYLIFKIFNKNKQMNGFYHIIGFRSYYLIESETTMTQLFTLKLVM